MRARPARDIHPDVVHVPGWVTDLASFRRWVDEDDLGNRRVGWLDGAVRIECTAEPLYSHNRVRLAIDTGLATLTDAMQIGTYFAVGVTVFNPAADLYAHPDGVFVSFAAFDAGRCRDVPMRRGSEFTRFEGTPDLVVEIVSPSSVTKDIDVLRKAYWTAGIPEYWLIDARRTRVRFGLLRHTARGYAATRTVGGWAKSVVLGRAFRLVETADQRGRPNYRLEVG